MIETIIARSSGAPPAAIAIIRISGPAAFAAVAALTGTLPAPRCASLRAVRGADGALLDRALILLFPGPASATGEDVAELHCHGGRAVTEAVQNAILSWPGLRMAEPGEFTRRALLNGRMDLAQAEGLADLLEAETEAQRRAALTATEGRVSAAVRGWMSMIADLAARVEATLDYAEEGDVEQEDLLLAGVVADAALLRAEIVAALAAPPVERLYDGLRVVIAGPPNAGKSTLLNLLSQREAAIVTPVAGTTRDRIEVAVRREEAAFLLIDTAGLSDAADPVEQIGVARARDAIVEADLLLWLGDDPPPRSDALWVHARSDLEGRAVLPSGRSLAISKHDLASIERCWQAVASQAERLLPRSGELPLKAAQRSSCLTVTELLMLPSDPLLVAEHLRTASVLLGRLLGINAPEAVLDALFARFCLGK